MMENILNVIVLVFVVFWFIGFVLYNTGGAIHALLAIAFISLVIRIIKEEKIY